MGFDENRFTKEVEDDFQCPICQDIMENPIASHYEHMFCSLCINEWLETESSCPVDKIPLNISLLYKPSRIFRNFYSKLLIKCEFESNGCKSIVGIEDLKSHQNKCDFNPNLKIICDKGCDGLLTKNEMISHNCVEYLKSINLKLTKELQKLKAIQYQDLTQHFHTKVSTDYYEINNEINANKTIVKTSSFDSGIGENLRSQSVTISLSDFSGKFKLSSSDNYDAFLKEMGINIALRNLAKRSTPIMEFSKVGTLYILKTITKVSDYEMKFELGKELEMLRMDGKHVKSIFKAEGNKLIQTQYGDKEMKIIYEFHKNELILTLTAGNVVCIRKYNRV